MEYECTSRCNHAMELSLLDDHTQGCSCTGSGVHGGVEALRTNPLHGFCNGTACNGCRHSSWCAPILSQLPLAVIFKLLL
jgi:hypothetical protein